MYRFQELIAAHFLAFMIVPRNAMPVSVLFSMLMYYNERIMRLRSSGIHYHHFELWLSQVCAQLWDWWVIW